ncbi:hypothetical protein C6Q21_18595 [Burkholderia multivorans]|uniref:hypothetical protein n=1 Tax=Burkholderia multivorans TaxID=87883 RepID=UPI000CFE5CEA|nr:hypothetical protein [Burkholderia multivorans]MCA7959537.1 hypothetical protein [Burkholderia multivorans]MDN7594856.1 hypothetical protein [Burkholderia multivorans]PRG05783.1 hypothetical protein C6Q21_18595 [Burkholderia multivorans]
MSASRKPEFSSDFLESYMYELMSMSDDEILEGHDVDAVKQRATQRIAAANREAGRKRLAAAKARVHHKEEVSPSQSSASLEEIRAYIHQAANDGRVTLAARQLSEMSDADARRLYFQLKQLMDDQGEAE